MRGGGIAWHLLMQCHQEEDEFGVSLLVLCGDIMNGVFVSSSGKGGSLSFWGFGAFDFSSGRNWNVCLPSTGFLLEHGIHPPLGMVEARFG